MKAKTTSPFFQMTAKESQLTTQFFNQSVLTTSGVLTGAVKTTPGFDSPTLGRVLHMNPCLVLVQPKKTRMDITEKLLTGT